MTGLVEHWHEHPELLEQPMEQTLWQVLREILVAEHYSRHLEADQEETVEETEVVAPQEEAEVHVVVAEEKEELEEGHRLGLRRL